MRRDFERRVERLYIVTKDANNVDYKYEIHKGQTQTTARRQKDMNYLGWICFKRVFTITPLDSTIFYLFPASSERVGSTVQLHNNRDKDSSYSVAGNYRSMRLGSSMYSLTFTRN